MVNVKATEKEITQAYHRLGLVYHPDKHRDADNKRNAEVLFSKVKKAYDGNILLLFKRLFLKLIAVVVFFFNFFSINKCTQKSHLRHSWHKRPGARRTSARDPL